MTLKRVRVYATLIALVLWPVLVFDYATPGNLDRFGKVKGTDFIQFYAAGSVLRDGRTDLLYDFETQQARRAALVPAGQDVIYVPAQNPLLLGLFAPLAALTYVHAFTAWVLLAAAVYFFSCRALWRACPALAAYRYETSAACAAFPAWFSTIAHGQPSIVGLAAVAAAVVALRRGLHVTAGLALGMLVFKPHWVLAAGAVFVAARQWKIVAGIAAGAVGQLLAAAAIMGASVMSAYFDTLRSLGRVADLLEPRAGYSLRSYATVFVTNEPAAWALYAAAAILVLAATAKIWRSTAPFEIRAAAVPISIVLICPHAFEYDLILLVPSYVLLASWIAVARDRGESAAPRYVAWALTPLFVAPILTALPAPVRVQFAVAPMGILLALLVGESTGATRSLCARIEQPHPESILGS